MQTISINTEFAQQVSDVQSISTESKLDRLIALSEKNRFGLVAALVLIQVSIAGFNVLIPPMVGASVWLMAPGILLAFLSNSIAFAQAKMKWVLFAFALSMVVNAVISLYCLFQL